MIAATGPTELRAQRRLVELEGVIQGGLQTFVEVGQALIEIRESRLYRFGGHTDIDDYLRDRWHMSRSYAHRIIEAAEVHAALPMGNAPTNERQSRELAPLLRESGPEAVREAWTAAVEATNGHPTAAAVREAVEDLAAPKPVPTSAPDAERWGELADLVKLLRAFTATVPVAVAVSVPARRRQSTARALRDFGTYLGHIALELEHLEGKSA